MIFSLFSGFFSLSVSADSTSDFMYYKTYSSLTGIEINSIPSTAYGTTFYDYGVQNGVDFQSVKPSGISDYEYNQYINGLQNSYIDNAVVSALVEENARDYTAFLSNTASEFTGIQSDFFYQTIWNNLLNREGYNTGLNNEPTYNIDYGSGSVSVNFAGYYLNDQSQIQYFEGDWMPSPFLGRTLNYFRYLPTYTPYEDVQKQPVFIGSAGGVSAYVLSAQVTGSGYISGIHITNYTSVNSTNQKYLRVEVYYTSPTFGEGYGGYWDIAVDNSVNTTDTTISYDGIDSNNIGYWLKKGVGGSPDEWMLITPSDIIVNGWDLIGNGYINIDGDLLPVYVDFNFDPVISAAITYCNNYPVSPFDDPYLKKYTGPYDDTIDIIRDSSQERDKYLKKIEQLLFNLTQKECKCPEWLKKIYYLLCDIYDFLSAVPDYAVTSNNFFDTAGSKTADFINSFNYTE